MRDRVMNIPRILVPCLCGVLLAGCSTVVNAHRQKSDMMHAYEAGENDAAWTEVAERFNPSSSFKASVVDTGDEVMWRLEAGSLGFHLGNFETCINELKRAEELIADYDERAVVSAQDAGSEVGVMLTNLNALPYRGFCRDRIALSIYKSLAYLGANREDAFRAQLRRLRDDQKKVQDDYRAFFDAQKKENDAAKSELGSRLTTSNQPAKSDAASTEEARKAEVQQTLEDLSDSGKLVESGQNAEFGARMTEVRDVAHKGYANFLNPMALFLSGLGSLRDGSYDNARIDFERLCEALPKNPLARRYYVTALRKAGREIPAGLADCAPFDFPVDADCVYVIFANGRGAAFEQIAVYVPVMTAWPICAFYPAPFGKLAAQAEGRSYDSIPLADMDGIIAQEFCERLPGMITRIVLSTLLKETAYYGSLAAIGSSDMDVTSKAVAWTSVAVGGAAYRAAVNTADTRTWETLPKEFRLTQLPMPTDRRMTVKLQGVDGSAREIPVALPAECRSAVVFVSAPSAANVKCHVLPIKSK